MTGAEVKVRATHSPDLEIVAVEIPVPKYARLEIERRWLVPRASMPALTGMPRTHIDDRYLEGGHLRFRKVTDASGATVRKLGKKYPPVSEGHAPVVSTYLTDAEAELLSELPGRSSRKHRYQINGGALDVYLHPKHPFAIFEIEFRDVAEAAVYVPPAFVGEEVTGNPEYSGYALATR